LFFKILSDQLFQLYSSIELPKDVLLHKIKTFSLEQNQLCAPFKCDITKLFWYIIKVSGILGKREIDMVLNFIHSPYFNLQQTPTSYDEIETFEPHLNGIYIYMIC
jgi:hypothetical protein